MRPAVFLAAALSSFAVAAPQNEPEPSADIGVIFVYADGTQSEQLWVPDSISQVPLSSGGVVDNVFILPPLGPQIPPRRASAYCAFLDAQSQGLGVGVVNGPGLEGK
ncbi:hypothetical protein TARUN_8000 [Trichoderma arundinaceum]|uniref:Uncharacterized protein n=1 Tax=Trichoderma arundinaceum TaxID=490622 RepID=A0A395NDQ2_TRIAR|nr:hypothetical protein TARUN_8000 [Trichoderma arundinaceum]